MVLAGIARRVGGCHKPQETLAMLIRLAVAGLCAGLVLDASAASISVSVRGSDAIFLAGRTDLTIPPANEPWTGPGDFLARHSGPTPEEIQETLPPVILVTGGDVIRVADPAVGGVSFFNGLGAPLFGPGGNGPAGSSLSGLGGISGYLGPQGPLTGVFLNDAAPDGSTAAPAALDFRPSGLGIEFASLSPLLGQVFYIGDGVTAGGDFQEFIAPTGATRLFLGIPDGFGFGGVPGAYDDNDGAYRVTIGVNQIPVPEPDALALLAVAAVAGVGLARRRRTR
jgi:hypothetical protein